MGAAKEAAAADCDQKRAALKAKTSLSPVEAASVELAVDVDILLAVAQAMAMRGAQTEAAAGADSVAGEILREIQENPACERVRAAVQRLGLVDEARAKIAEKSERDAEDANVDDGAEAFVRRAMEGAGVAPWLVNEKLPEATRVFHDHLAECHGVWPRAEVMFEQYFDKALEVRKKEYERHFRENIYNIRVNAEKIVWKVLSDAGCPPEIIEERMPMHMNYFCSHMALGRSASSAEREFKELIEEGLAQHEKELSEPAEPVSQKQSRRSQDAQEADEIAQTVRSHRQNPDLSGALYVLSLLDKLDAKEAQSEQQNASETKTSGWRHASKEDYGRAMRGALEELAESDRREVQRIHQAYEKQIRDYNSRGS